MEIRVSKRGNGSLSLWKRQGTNSFYQTVIRVLLQVADTFLFFNSIVGILFMAVFRGKRISTKGDLNNKTAFV